MVHIIYGGQLFSQVVNLCLLNKDLLNFKPPYRKCWLHSCATLVLATLVSAFHRHKNILCYTRYSIVQSLSNKQSVKVFCKFDQLKTAHSKS